MKYLVILGISALISINPLTRITYQPINVPSLVENIKEKVLKNSLTNRQFCKNDTAYAEETSPSKIIEKLSAYLPQKVINNMNRFDSEETSDGNLNYIWYRLKSDEPNAILHDIQLTATKTDNKLLFYHYKDYGYNEGNLLLQNISKESAYDMVTHFAQEFIPTKEELKFVNKPSYFSLYDPNHVESWVAEGKFFSHIIMINLDYGYVEFYSCEKK